MNSLFDRSSHSVPLRITTLCICVVLFNVPSVSFAQVSPDSLSTSALKMRSLEELMEIEITIVSKTPERLLEVPAAVTVISENEIRRSGAMTIPEALRLAENLHVAQKNSHSWGISARGFNTELANKLLVLFDGRSIYTPLFSGVFWDVQDYLMEDLDRIEVVSGPGGSVWGANAVNGVINIITKKSSQTQGLYAEAGGGTELETFGGVRYGGMIAPDIAYRVYGKYFTRGGAVLGDGSDAKDPWNMGRGGFRIDAEPSIVNHYTLQGDYFSNHEDVPTGGTSNHTGLNLLGRWSHTISETANLSLQFYYDRTDLNLPTAAIIINSIEFAPAGTFKDKLDTYDLEFQHNFRLGESHEITWGVGYRFMHDVVNSSPGLGFYPETLDRSRYSAFLQDKIDLLFNKLSLTLGTKIEHTHYTGIEVEPTVRVHWQATPSDAFWTAASRAVRAPSRIDRDIANPAPPNLVVLSGGPNFISETVIAYEAGYRTQFGETFTASLSAFYNQYDHIRSTSSTPQTILPFFFENNLEGETYGFEFITKYQITDWWRIHSGYSLLKERLRIKPGKEDFNNALNETSDPQQQFSIRSSMDLPAGIELVARFRWIDLLPTHDGPTSGTVPSYAELDVRVGWHPTQTVELSLTGQNLLHTRHPEYDHPTPSRIELQRGLYGKISLRL